jgi:hypothetical protein
MISAVYKNENNIPVNKQAVYKFFRDHNYIEPDFNGNRYDGNISIRHFNKATGKLRESFGDLPIDIICYERVCSSIRRAKVDALPKKHNKLIRHIMHMNNCNKKLAIVIINKMREERFINVVGDYVEYF